MLPTSKPHNITLSFKTSYILTANFAQTPFITNLPLTCPIRSAQINYEISFYTSHN